MKFNLLGKTTIAVMMLSTLALSGCKSAPVYNVNNSPIITIDDKKITSKNVRNLILRAGLELGWVMNPISDGEIQATLNLRKHSAVVRINYDAKSYSINYVSSSNLSYSDGNIHSNYNGWIQRLDNRIRSKVSGITLEPSYTWSPIGVFKR